MLGSSCTWITHDMRFREDWNANLRPAREHRTSSCGAPVEDAEALASADRLRDVA
jgi:hypothetical protein